LFILIMKYYLMSLHSSDDHNDKIKMDIIDTYVKYFPILDEHILAS